MVEQEKREIEKESVDDAFRDNWIKETLEKGEDMIKKELLDYWWLMGSISKVYKRVTNGILSKPNTDPDKLLELYEQQRNEERDEINSKKDIELLEKIKKFKERIDTPTLQRFKNIILKIFNNAFELEEE